MENVKLARSGTETSQNPLEAHELGEWGQGSPFLKLAGA